jgi:hypothetical protein
VLLLVPRFVNNERAPIVRCLLLAVSVAILLTSAACQVRVAKTMPSARHYPSPAAPAHPPLSEVAVIYADQWGISEPDYFVLRDELHLSDDDIGVVLFLSAQSSWDWRRIAVQRRAGHNWKAITRMAGLTPLVYFVDVPRGADLRSPYHRLYDQYWRHRSQPRRIHLRDSDCVAMARLHLVRDRYGYDPVAYMAPGPRQSHRALVQKLEQQRRTGTLRTALPSKPVAQGKVHKKNGHDHEGRVAPVVSHGPPPDHRAESRRVKAGPPTRSDDRRVVEQRPSRAPTPHRVATPAKPSTKGARREQVARKGRADRPRAGGVTDAAADATSSAAAKGHRPAAQQPPRTVAGRRGKVDAVARGDAEKPKPVAKATSPTTPPDRDRTTRVTTKSRTRNGGTAIARGVTRTPSQTATANETGGASGPANGKDQPRTREDRQRNMPITVPPPRPATSNRMKTPRTATLAMTPPSRMQTTTRSRWTAAVRLVGAGHEGSPSPQFSPASCYGGARPRICCVALGSGARRTASTPPRPKPARALHLRTLAPPHDEVW